jgi:hypothetical protein
MEGTRFLSASFDAFRLYHVLFLAHNMDMCGAIHTKPDRSFAIFNGGLGSHRCVGGCVGDIQNLGVTKRGQGSDVREK